MTRSLGRRRVFSLAVAGVACGCSIVNPAYDPRADADASTDASSADGTTSPGGTTGDATRADEDATSTLDEPSDTSGIDSQASATPTSTGSSSDPQCGDGVVDEAEACDDASPGHLGDHCQGCTYTFRTVFVTEATYGGDLGGVVGADALCQLTAEAVGLHGVFAAWLASSPLDAPNVRFEQFDGEYRRIDQQVVATSWQALTQLDLLAPIELTELGQPISGASCVEGGCAWTGADRAGASTDSPLGGTCPGNCSCTGWTAAGSGGGVAGAPLATTDAWSVAAQVQCNLPQHLYCVQQVL